MIRYVQEYNFKDKKALIRVDFNVPLNDNFCVVDDTRITRAVPTIHKVLNDGGAVMLMSHLGRPKQGYEARFSLQYLIPHLIQSLGVEVAFASSCTGTATQAQAKHLQPGQVLLLENLRFHAGEVTGDPGFAQELAALGDVYVNDAFGTAHRAHASTVVVAQYFEDKLAGYLMQEELANADRLLQDTQKPFTAIIGGTKISDKIKPIEQLLNQVDYLLVGGGVANTFQKALGRSVSTLRLEHDELNLAYQLAAKAQQKGVQLVLPVDVVIADRMEAEADIAVVDRGDIPAGWMALDIGPSAQQEFADIIQASQTILWCGPVGVFEIPTFQKGTQAVALAVARATLQGAFALVGGGDSAAAMQLLGYSKQISYLSTGGSALLAYLGSGRLPGVAALQGCTLG